MREVTKWRIDFSHGGFHVPYKVKLQPCDIAAFVKIPHHNPSTDYNSKNRFLKSQMDESSLNYGNSQGFHVGGNWNMR